MAVLAVDGGPKTVPEGSIKSWPIITEADRQAVLQVFDNNQFHNFDAPFAQELQERWAAYCGVSHCLALNGGTGALHMALLAVGVRAGDEVITSAYSFWATSAAILHQNAIPVFVDVDPATATIDPALIEEKISPHTAALMPVHIHGMPADMDPIMEIAQKHGLGVVSDSCQSHGAVYKGRRVGSIAQASGFSLNRSKNLTGGEGGLFTTDDERLLRRAEATMRFQNVPDENGWPAFSGLGYNYRPHEFINALVCRQLDRLDEMNDQRRDLARFLTAAFADIPGIEGPSEPDYADPVYWCYMVEVRPDQLGLDVAPDVLRAGLCRALQAEGVPASPVQRLPVPAEPVLQAKWGYGKGCPWKCRPDRDLDYAPDSYPMTQRICASRAFLGSVYPPNDMELMGHYVEGVAKVLAQPDRLLALAEEQ